MKKYACFLLLSLLCLLLFPTSETIISDFSNQKESDELYCFREGENILECGGFIATGSVCKNNRSIFLKNRHSGKPGTMKPFYYEGSNHSFIAFGTHEKGDGRPYCRMGINEKGLAIGNFDQTGYLSDGNWKYISDHSSENEDYDMWYVLSNYQNVSDAANYLVHHASYSCEWGIISAEQRVGAIVAMDEKYHGNISWINNSYTTLGNKWYCENQMNEQMKRTQYLADRIHYQGKGSDADQPTKFTVQDVTKLLAKDVNASNNGHPYWSEPCPGDYKGSYQLTGGDMVSNSSTSCMVAIAGNTSFNQSLNHVWFTSGYSPHVGIFVPLSASYLSSNQDIPTLFTFNSGLQYYTTIAQSYSSISPGAYNRSRTHEVHNCTDLAEQQSIDYFYEQLDSFSGDETEEFVKNKMSECSLFILQRSLNLYNNLFLSKEENTFDLWYHAGNHHYRCNKTMSFDIVETSETSFQFNDTTFILSPSDNITITIDTIATNTRTTRSNQSLVRFFVSSNFDEKILFEIGGFQPNYIYSIYVNDTCFDNLTSNDHGVISFQSNYSSFFRVNIVSKKRPSDFIPFLSWYPNARIPKESVVMNVTDGTSSYFNITLSNVSDGYHVTNGSYFGWCFEKSVQMTRDKDHQVKLCHSYDPDMPEAFRNVNWSMINYVINNKGDLSRQEIQDALWDYINGIEPSSSSVRSFLDDASEQGNDFQPSIGDRVAVLVYLDPEVNLPNDYPPVQNTFIEVPLLYSACNTSFWCDNHQVWPDPIQPDDLVGNYFDVPYFTDFEEYALSEFLCGSINGQSSVVGYLYAGLIREAITGLLNANYDGIQYPITHEQLIVSVHDSFNSISSVAQLYMIFQVYNNM
jgi:hypothetical protein